MTNKFSNYFVQVFIQKCPADFKRRIVLKLMSEPSGRLMFVKTCINQIGTHCMQKFIDSI